MSEFESADFPREQLAVIGLSCLFPKAANAGEFWSNIRQGVDAITEVPSTHWNAGDYFDADPKSPDMTYARRGGFLSPVAFDPLEYGIAPSNLEAIDTSQLLGMVGAKRALEDAGYGANREFDRSRVGCILGVTGTLEMVIPLGARLGHPKWRQALKDAGVADDVAADVIQRISDSYVPWQENSFPGLLGNVVAGRIANRLDLGGTNCVVDAACASSLSAMHLATLELWSGRSDMVVTGGIDTFNDIFMFMCFSKTPALSPTGDAKPFSDSGDGTILGEGVGMVVLKRLSDARRDGDKIYALIKGIGTSSDGAGNAVYAPKKEGQVRCLQDAYRIAGVSPETVELIEAHGTGTKVGDATELAGLTEVFQATGKTGRWCAVGSIKSQIGHTKAAAGAAGVLKVILALQHRVLPPTIKIERPLPALLDETSPLYANTQARPWLATKAHPRRAGVSAFGFGGSNFHCVLEESPAGKAEIDWDGDVLLAAWSADSREELSSHLNAWRSVTDRAELRRMATLSRQSFQPKQLHRLVMATDLATADVPQLVATAQASLRNYADRTVWSTPDGISYGSGPQTGKLGLLFPGQGSQYVGMQREVACRFPMLQSVLTEANDVFAEFAPERGRLSDFIYPIPAFEEETKAQQESALRATEIAQPALGAVSLGLLVVLAEFGVKPDVVAGHSYGELTALCASKRFRPAALYRLSMLRGKLMAEAQDVAGGMLAVGAPLSQVEAALKESAVDLVIANRNSPTQVVLSGRIAELDRANEIFARKNIRGKRLQVAAAFHSPLVARASQRFRPVLDEIEFFEPEVPVYANTHAEEYPKDADAARSLLAGQLARPVEFVRQIENMYSAGVRLFVEVGPGAVLTGLVDSILSGREHRGIAVDASSGKRSGMLDLALALGQLGAAGYPVKYAAWDPQSRRAESATDSGTPRLTIPICGANYVKLRTPRPPAAVQSALRTEAVASRLVETSNPRPAPPNPPPTLLLLQQMHDQTARLHRQFLEGQEAALRTLESLANERREPYIESREPEEYHPVLSTQYSVLSTQFTVPDVQPVRALSPVSRATAVSAPRAASPPIAEVAQASTELTAAVLSVVAEKTGYPVEMLKPEMSLDHDLGIDSIKRVEILSALQERRPDLPVVQPEQLGTLHRLSDVIGLLNATSPSPQSPAVSHQPAHRSEAVVVRRNETPEPSSSTLSPHSSELSLGVPCAVPLRDAGPLLPLAPGSTLCITDDDSGLALRIAARLTELGYRARLVRLDEPAAHAIPDDLAGLVVVAPERGISDQQLWRALEWTQKCGAALRGAGKRQAALLATISRMDGQFGWSAVGQGGNPLSGALAGLTKTVRHEWPGVTAKAVDCPTGAVEVNDLVAQLLTDGPAEIGWTSSGWQQVEIRQPPADRRSSPPIQAGELIVITGGARGVTAAAAVAVARAWRPRLVLCGRTPLAETEPEWMHSLETAAQIKQAIAQHSPAGKSLRQIDQQARQALANREVRATLEAIRELGADVEYLAVDVRDPYAVQHAFSRLQRQYGPIRGVIHGAGVLEDRRIEDKTREQFENVFATKILGLRNVLSALNPEELRCLAVFSSYTARFGRTGQVDYAMANEALNKLAGQFQRQHPRCRVRAFNWGPWDGGMVTDALKPLFAKEGVGLIPLDAGARLLVHELERTEASSVEIVVLAVQQQTFDQVTPAGPSSAALVDSASNADLAKAVLSVVAEKTGYPVEMLKPEMSLDHDLGIDSIKRVEILSALQERRPDLPVVQPEQLGTLHRLSDVIGLLNATSPSPQSPAVSHQPAHRSEAVVVRRNETPGLQPAMANAQFSSGRCGWERVLDLAGHPYLASHVLGGKAVLPTAMIAECLTHAALHHHPGLEFVGLMNLRIFNGVRVEAQDRVTLRGMVEKAVRTDDAFRVPVRLLSAAHDRDVLHAQAEVLLSNVRLRPPQSQLERVPMAGPLAPPNAWYGSLLFHGPHLHGLTSIESLSGDSIVVRARTAPAPADWLADPWRTAWLTDPLIVDVTLQALIVWTQTVCGRASLPTAIAEYRQYRRSFPADGVRIVLRAVRRNDSAVSAEAEILDDAGEVIATLSGIEHVLDAQLSKAFQRNHLA